MMKKGERLNFTFRSIDLSLQINPQANIHGTNKQTNTETICFTVPLVYNVKQSYDQHQSL